MPRTANTTAEGVAAWRAAGAMERDASVRNPDYLVIRLLGPKWRLISRIRPLVRLMILIYNRIIPGGYCFHIARTKHIDACLREALEEGIEQLVIMGAGYGTRAYRFEGLLAGARVFELDLPGVIEEKKRRVVRMLGREPAHVVYVPIDFMADSLESSLLAHGYNPSLRTFFIWEGVCMYLTAGVVDDVLRFVASSSASGSSIAFDYLLQDVIDGTTPDRDAIKAARYVAKLGEPYIFGIGAGEIESFLKERGLTLLSQVSPQELEDRYLRKSDGRLLGCVYQYTRIVRAGVP